MKRILVIDDEVWLVEMVKMALNQRGYEVIEANDGPQGVEMARKELPDLILCDVNMKKLDGYGTLSALRNEPSTATIPFILMTGMADNAGMRQGMELGADDYLPKPFTLDGLFGAVEARLKKAKTVQEKAQGALTDLRQNLSMMLPHELRTPLNGILAYGDMLVSDPSSFSPEEIADMGQTIAQSGRALERLVGTFLAYSQVEILRADPQVNVSLRAKRTVNAAQSAEVSARKQADEAKRPEDLELNLKQLTVGMSEEYFSKVVSELTHNAFKFSKPGTPVSMTLDSSMGTVWLTVSDRGRGMTADQVTKIGAFMQFDRKTHEQQGLGLGLTIARQLAEIHGGALTVQSELGIGTTATAKLPMVT
ncbi:MAG: hybrid sensor histidine kinase/response regulator [Verrucomicrobia bacterium]|jgi:signal transduction histidine kinase|nr:MAG: hybrid sensor histidine kinase/response regulator [Verrucomicrobiota bacterium]